MRKGGWTPGDHGRRYHSHPDENRERLKEAKLGGLEGAAGIGSTAGAHIYHLVSGGRRCRAGAQR